MQDIFSTCKVFILTKKDLSYVHLRDNYVNGQLLHVIMRDNYVIVFLSLS